MSFLGETPIITKNVQASNKFTDGHNGIKNLGAFSDEIPINKGIQVTLKAENIKEK